MTETNHVLLWRHARWRIAALGIGILVMTQAMAAGGDTPLSLGAAIQRALVNHPRITGSALTLTAARAQRDELAQPTPWNLDLEVENIAGSGQYSGLGSVEATAGVFKRLERGDKPRLRAAVGDTAVDLGSARQDAVRIEVAADVAAAFFATLAQQQRAALGQTSLELAQTVRDTVAQRIAVGRSAEAELATAEIGLARARYAADRTLSDLTVHRNKLAAFMADQPSRFGELRGDLFALPELDDAQSLQTRLADNPQLKQLETRQAALTAQRRLAQAQARTDLTVGASVRRLEQTDDMALVFSVNLPLGQKQRAAPGIDYARAQERSAPQATETRRLQLLAQLHQLSGNLSMTKVELGILQTEIIPLAERAVELYEAGYARGRYGLFELNDAQQTLLVARQDAITAAERYQQLTIGIRSLLGEMPVEGTAP